MPAEGQERASRTKKAGEDTGLFAQKCLAAKVGKAP
jgi:hypothetical protein